MVVRKPLKDRYVDAKAKNKDGNTVLIVASKKGDLRLFRELLKAGDNHVDSDAKDLCGRTALFSAICSGHVHVFRELFKRKGRSKSIPHDDGFTRLSWVCKRVTICETC